VNCATLTREFASQRAVRSRARSFTGARLAKKEEPPRRRRRRHPVSRRDRRAAAGPPRRCCSGSSRTARIRPRVCPDEATSDVRLIAATHRDLQAAIEGNAFERIFILSNMRRVRALKPHRFEPAATTFQLLIEYSGSEENMSIRFAIDGVARGTHRGPARFPWLGTSGSLSTRGGGP